MSKYISTTFGSISGRHGTAVAAVQKDGTTVLRVFNPPSNPRTEAQTVQRAKFAMVNQELSVMSKLFQSTFRNNRGINKAVSLAFREAVTGDYPNFRIDYSKLTLASGNVQSADLINMIVATGTTVNVTWDTTEGIQGNIADGVNLVFMNTTSKITLLKEVVAMRSEGRVDVELPSAWAGAAVHCWIYFTAPDMSATSKSQYVSLLQL